MSRLIQASSLSLVAALGLVGRPVDAGILGLIALGAAISRQVLMPRINTQRDRMLAGETEAEARFNRLHRASVWINGLQLLGALAVLVRLGLD